MNILLFYLLSSMLFITSFLKYNLPLWQIISIASLAYIIEKILFYSKRTFVIISSTTTFLLMLYGYILHRMERLEEVVIDLQGFLKIYLLSITEPNVFIADLHQQLAVFAIALIIATLMHYLLAIRKLNPIWLVIILFITTTAGFMSGFFNTLSAKIGFVLFVITAIVHYFIIFHQVYISRAIAFKPIISTISLVLILVLGASSVGYHFYPKPLYRDRIVEEAVYTEGGTGNAVVEAPVPYQLTNNVYRIESSFEHKNIALFRVKRENLNYIKSEVYEIYKNGVWIKNIENSIGRVEKINESKQIKTANFQDYYHLEELEFIIDSIKTDIVFTGPYANFSANFSPIENQTILFDNTRDTYSATGELPLGYRYKLKTIVPKYGGRAFKSLVDIYAKRNPPIAVTDYATNLPVELINPLQEIALQVTSDIDGAYNKALALENFLRTEFAYSESTESAPENTDPILYFLTESKSGFCQQFSSSLILLLRSIDIPARYVKGYYLPTPGNIDDRGGLAEVAPEAIVEGFEVVHDYNAHTWVEVYFPEVGWITLEPTPGIQHSVYETNDLLEPLPEINDAEVTHAVEQDKLRWHISANQIILLLIAIVLLFLIYLFLRYKLHLIQQSNEVRIKSHYKMIRLYYEGFDIKKRPSETHLEYANRIDKKTQPVYNIPLNQLIKSYEAIVYGNKSAEDEDLIHYMAYLKSLRYLAKYRISKLEYYRNLLIEMFSI